MLDKLIKGALLLTTGAAIGAAGAMWLMSDNGKKAREELKDLASQAQDKLRECCEKVKQEVENAGKAAEEPAAEQA